MTVGTAPGSLRARMAHTAKSRRRRSATPARSSTMTQLGCRRACSADRAASPGTRGRTGATTVIRARSRRKAAAPTASTARWASMARTRAPRRRVCARTAGPADSAPIAVGETVILLTPPFISLLKHLLTVKGGRSRMTVSPTARHPCRGHSLGELRVVSARHVPTRGRLDGRECHLPLPGLCRWEAHRSGR